VDNVAEPPKKKPPGRVKRSGGTKRKLRSRAT
jgi:hypothetical protein